jgi:hypothetical protein
VLEEGMKKHLQHLPMSAGVAYKKMPDVAS